MVKIAYIIDTIDSPTGGTEKQLLLLLEKLDRTRFSPVLCVLYTSDWLENHFNLCPLHVLNITSNRHPVTLYRFLLFVRYLKTENICIVHSFFKDGMRVGITAAKLARVPHIIAVRRNQGYWMTPLDLRITKVLNRWVDLLIANAHNTKAWAAEVEGFPVDRIKVVHNGIDLEPFRRNYENTRKAYREKLAIPEGAVVIGIVANLRPVKALDGFIRAAKLVCTALPQTHFIIVGEGPLEGTLKLQAQCLDMGSSIHFLGRRLDIPQILSTFDIGVLSSSSESFSNTIVEYLAAGLPVVCTEVGGAREAVEDYVNGFVVPPSAHEILARRLLDVLASDNVAMGQAGRLKAEKEFSLVSMVQAHEQIYKELALKKL
jgi:L-malate glycosyltransferase